VNGHAPLRITATILEHNRFSSGESRVVFVTSSLGRPESALSFAGMGLYSVTKATLSRLALIQAREFELRAPHVRVLRVHPGIVDTDMQTSLRRDANLESDIREEDGGTACIPRGGLGRSIARRALAHHPDALRSRVRVVGGEVGATDFERIRLLPNGGIPSGSFGRMNSPRAPRSRIGAVACTRPLAVDPRRK
jgi:NAD(P)-dependent dehydrogenase (short-subunit alcohol dehydrogenase family)